ncbi:hypothetical protein DL95DRAFT_398581 [Leptodontidium sp. 2 PMI_412]|nr:hypothetical protein DL95DRAFT_398581 [Leptodontidium sp. 2 PMI_412]
MNTNPQIKSESESEPLHIEQNCNSSINTWLSCIYNDYTDSQVWASADPYFLSTSGSEAPCSQPASWATARMNTMVLPEEPAEDEIASVSSSTRTKTASLASRPILSPTPPSLKRTRSASPTRKLMTQLGQARPPVLFYQPGREVSEPQLVGRLRSDFSKGLRKGIIPSGLTDRIRLASPNEWSDLPEDIFGSDDGIPDLDRYWGDVDRIYVEAERCQNRHKDENAWVTVVRAVLDMMEEYSHDKMLEVNSVQTQQIDPSFLPILPNTTTIVKKADIAIGFSPYNAVTGRRIQSYLGLNQESCLSHMSDAYTSTIPLVCGIEVKESGGDYNEAVTQLGIWSAACLEKLKQLHRGSGGATDSLGSGESLLPIVGWTVVGHEWKLHICWKSMDGAVTVLGPISNLKAGTGSYEELFTLLALVRRVRIWLCSEFWKCVESILKI